MEDEKRKKNREGQWGGGGAEKGKKDIMEGEMKKEMEKYMKMKENEEKGEKMKERQEEKKKERIEIRFYEDRIK
jgi:hypothetical protein